MLDERLAGVCGIYCGACMIYRAYKDQDQALIQYLVGLGVPKETIHCEGCTSGIVPQQCAKCGFKDCAAQKGIAFCSDCKDLPCKSFIELSEERAKKDNLPHLRLCPGSLDVLKQVGVQEWLKQQDKRWSCESCGRRLHWYTEKCPSCDAKFYNAVEEANDLKRTLH
jgi:hypothetical protein